MQDACTVQRVPDPPCLLSTLCCWLQVLREARAVYRVVCEGVINLADKFFEMERADALK